VREKPGVTIVCSCGNSYGTFSLPVSVLVSLQPGGGCERRPPGAPMFNQSSSVMGGPQNSAQSRYQVHHQQQQQQQQLGYQLPGGNSSAVSHPAAEHHHVTSVIAFTSLLPRMPLRTAAHRQKLLPAPRRLCFHRCFFLC